MRQSRIHHKTSQIIFLSNENMFLVPNYATEIDLQSRIRPNTSKTHHKVMLHPNKLNKDNSSMMGENIFNPVHISYSS